MATQIVAEEFTTRLQAGTYRAKTDCTITHYRRTGESKVTVEYQQYSAGEQFEVPKSVNGFWYGLDANGDLFNGYAPAVIEVIES